MQEPVLFKQPAKKAELGAAIKRARDIMRKDAGMNGDLDRLPQFSWLLFLKALDAQEEDREALLGPDEFRPLVEPPYRWRDWAAPPNLKARSTGDALLKFVNEQLLPYLRKRSGSDELDVVGTIFRDVQNRMLSGVLLREVVDLIDKIDFHERQDIHTMAHMYESMLQEMRDAAGDSGEFYTPRPVIRFMVKMVDPKPGEVVLDPACGTGGFLVETYRHVRERYQDRLTARGLRELEEHLVGIEKKPLPFLLGMMNMILHGVERPHLVRDNALAHPLAEQRLNRVNVVLTNPPFGGEEESNVPKYFPADTRTTETAWLFLQLVIEKLKPQGRCGIVVPNSIMFGGGVGAKVKENLLKTCNLHTVVRLPNGVFAPYTLIPCNLLFFNKTGPTKAIWFYEVPLPEGRRNYTKTRPFRDSGFDSVEAWCGGPDRKDRQQTEHAWRVPVRDLIANGYNLDLKNPNRTNDLEHRSPKELIADLIATEQEILGMLQKVQAELGAI